MNSIAVYLLVIALLFSPRPAQAIDDRVEAILQNMTLEQKIGQLMMVGFGGKEMGPEISDLLTKHHIGSVALYSRNIVNNRQLIKLVRDIRKVMRNEVQPFVAIDQEGGNVVRVRSDVIILPGAMALGATRDPVLAFLAGQANAIDLGLLGVDMNLAPVLDVNRNPHNPVINIRAFGDHPKLVSKLGLRFIQGQQQSGMATVAKHFPGHGATSHDSHFDLPVLNLTREQLHHTELVPFTEAFAAGLDALMTAHVRVPALDPSGTPASLSREVITGLLREELNYSGIVITDDLEMRAIAERMSAGEAAVKALSAGADIIMVIWTPKKKHEVFVSLLDAVREGRIPLSRVDESVSRILRLKIERGTIDALSSESPELSSVLPNPLHEKLTQTVARRSITLVKNEDKVVPLCNGKGVLVIGPQKVFLAELKRLLPGTLAMPTRRVPSKARRRKDLKKAISLARGQRVIVVAVVNAYQAWLVQKLCHSVDIPVMAVSFGSPYFLRNFPAVSAYACAYSYLESAQRAAARALAGTTSITGRLPVKLTEKYNRGHGLQVNRKACEVTRHR